MTCEEGEFENDEGVPAPEFDCVVDLEEGSIRDIILKDSQNSPDSQPLQAEVSLVSSPIDGVQDPSSHRRSSRFSTSKSSPVLPVKEDLTADVIHRPVGL